MLAAGPGPSRAVSRPRYRAAQRRSNRSGRRAMKRSGLPHHRSGTIQTANVPAARLSTAWRSWVVSNGTAGRERGVPSSSAGRPGHEGKGEDDLDRAPDHHAPKEACAAQLRTDSTASAGHEHGGPDDTVPAGEIARVPAGSDDGTGERGEDARSAGRDGGQDQPRRKETRPGRGSPGAAGWQVPRTPPDATTRTGSRPLADGRAAALPGPAAVHSRGTSVNRPTGRRGGGGDGDGRQHGELASVPDAEDRS